MTLDLEVDSFDTAAQEDFKASLAAQLDVSASAIELTIVGGSLIVAVRIRAPPESTVDALVSTLSSPALSAAIGYTIEAVSAPAVEMVSVFAPSPPPPTLPSMHPPSPIEPLDASLESDLESDLESLEPGGNVLVIGIIVGAGSALLFSLVFFFVFRRVQAAKAVRASRSAISVANVEVELDHEPSQTSSTLLPASFDEVLLTTRVTRLQAMLRPNGQQWITHTPGVLRAAVATDSEMRITKGRLYIEQAVAAGASGNGLLEQWPLSSIRNIKRRRYELGHTALELEMDTQREVLLLLNFSSTRDRESVVQTLLAEKPQLTLPDQLLEEMTERWCSGDVDNFTYLMHVNDCASRSLTDLAQYPIM